MRRLIGAGEVREVLLLVIFRRKLERSAQIPKEPRRSTSLVFIGYQMINVTF
jgi:hypothetical protein